MNKKFVRSKNRKIAGVCGGIAEYLNIDPVIVRAIFLCLLIFGGSGFIIYLILLIVMPNEDTNDTSYTKADTNEKDNQADNNENEEIKDYSKNIQKKAIHSGSLVFGLLLIFIGIFFFLRNFFPFLRFEYWFPLGLVFLGILLIVFSKKSKKE